MILQLIRFRVVCGDGIIQIEEGESCDPPVDGYCNSYCELICQTLNPGLGAVCISGQWVIPMSVTLSREENAAGVNVLVLGNLTLSSNITLIVNNNTNISASGCIELSGTLEIDTIYPDNSTFHPFTSPCISGSFDSIVTPSSCQSVSGNSLKTGELFSLTVNNNGQCRHKTSNLIPILAGILGGAAILVIIIIVTTGFMLYKRYSLSVVFRSRESNNIVLAI